MNAMLKPEHIGLQSQKFNVRGVQAELALHPELWNEYRGRTNHPQSPHRGTDDIWLRFAEDNLNDPDARVMGPHKSVWYPSANQLPLAKSLAMKMFDLVKGKEMGGVLIIRIPPGKEIYPHVDSAWHAEYYNKIAIQIEGNAKQEFAFEDGCLSALPGQMYWLDNSYLHWVTNPTQKDWINMTVCYRN